MIATNVFALYQEEEEPTPRLQVVGDFALIH